RRRHTRSKRDWSSDVCSSDLENRQPQSSAWPQQSHYQPPALAPSSGQGPLQYLLDAENGHLPKQTLFPLLPVPYQHHFLFLATKIGRASCRETKKISVRLLSW